MAIFTPFGNLSGGFANQAFDVSANGSVGAGRRLVSRVAWLDPT